jgi:hypothetical protein
MSLDRLEGFQRKIAIMAWAGAAGLVIEVVLMQPWYGSMWQVGTAVALVTAVMAIFVYRGNVAATRGEYGGLACALGASIVGLLWFVPGWPYALPASVDRLTYGLVALATTAVLGAAFAALHRRRRELKGPGINGLSHVTSPGAD